MPGKSLTRWRRLTVGEAMSIFLGIDGGGTKTRFLLASEDGQVRQEYTAQGISLRQYPLDEVVCRIDEGIRQCVDGCGVTREQIEAICIGYPCYGESRLMDAAVRKAVTSKLAPCPILFVNDVVVGWAGALQGMPGIHVVSGTGSIAYGRTEKGRQARCGGWLDFFSDEGSAYWLGRQAMGLFCKEADGRADRGALYDIVHQKFPMEDDMEFVDIMARDYIPYRHMVASFQLILLEAAHAGDLNAQRLYETAVEELVGLVCGARDALELTGGFKVSFSGSLFLERELILGPFCRAVSSVGGTVVPPAQSPVEGAVLLAREMKGGANSIWNEMP